MAPARPDPYRRAARWYDSLIEPLNRKLKAIALGFWPPVPGTAVLDVGCGTGTLLQMYQQAGCAVWGLDQSPAMLRVARRRLGPRAELHQGDARQLPFGDGQFDRVAFSMVLHEMAPSERCAALGETARVLRGGGEVVVIDYAGRRPSSARGWALRLLAITIERGAGGDHWRGYRHFLRDQGAEGLAAALGWEVLAERVVGDGNMAISVLRPGARAGETA